MLRFYVFLALVFLAPLLVHGDIYISGSNSNTALGGGIIASGTDVTSPSLYRTPELIKDLDPNETDSGKTPLSTIDVMTIAGEEYFRIFFDQQETGGGNTELSLTDLVINLYDITDTTFSNPTLFWDYDQVTNGPIVLNHPSQNPTGSPLGNGTDMALLIKRSLFNGLDFRGEDILELIATEGSDGDNGGEEFASLKDGVGGVFIPPNQLIGIPEPAAATWLAVAAGILLVGRLRLRAC